MGRDQRRVEGVGEDETVKRQTRRGGGGCRRCYGLLHINIYDYSDSSVEFSTLFYFLTGSLSISRYFSLTSRVSTNSIFCPIWPCARCACPRKCEETGDYCEMFPQPHQRVRSSFYISTYLQGGPKKVCSQKTKIGHGGGFLKKKSMTNKIKKFL